MFRITFETTDKCNMHCKYCYLEHKQEALSEETAMKALDVFERENVDNDSLMVSYIGGEPLLCKDKIIMITNQIQNRMKELGKPVSFVITTNATLLDERIMDFFIEKKFSIKISLDGDKKSHDSNRVMLDGTYSYDTIMNKIPLLLSYQNQMNKLIQVSMVINKNTYKNLYNNFLSVCKLGFKYICPCLETYADWTKEELGEIELQYKKIIDYMLNEVKNNNFIYWKMLLVEYDKRKLTYDCLYCFPGRNSMHVKVNGDIYACYACQKEPFKIGTIDKGYDKKIYKNFEQYNPQFSQECKNCDYLKYCSAKECIAVNYERTKKMWEVPFCFCELAKIAERMYKYFELQKKQVLIKDNK